MEQWTQDELYNSVEPILRNYKTMKAQAELDKQNLKELFAKCTASYDGMPHGTEVSNQTLNIVMSRDRPSSAMLKAMAIEIIYNSLKKEWQEWCNLYYFEQEDRFAVMTHMKIDKNKFYFIRNKVIEKFKDMLPWKTFNKDC